MKENIKELYQEIILEHSKNPRNFKGLDNPTACANGHNAMCGDKLKVCLKLDNDKVIKDISFKGVGCAICIASASLMTEAVKNQTVDEAKKIFDYFHKMVTEDNDFETKNITQQRLAALSGVKKYPTRVKCATLAWHTLVLACQNKDSHRCFDIDHKKCQNCSCE